MTRITQKVPEDRLKTISDKVKAHEISLATVQELYKLVVTGDFEHRTPGLMETSRRTADAVERMEKKLDDYRRLDERVSDIEQRHVIQDKASEKKRDEMKNYKFYFITMGVTQVITLLISVFFSPK